MTAESFVLCTQTHKTMNFSMHFQGFTSINQRPAMVFSGLVGSHKNLRAFQMSFCSTHLLLVIVWMRYTSITMNYFLVSHFPLPLHILRFIVVNLCLLQGSFMYWLCVFHMFLYDLIQSCKKTTRGRRSDERTIRSIHTCQSIVQNTSQTKEYVTESPILWFWCPAFWITHKMVAFNSHRTSYKRNCMETLQWNGWLCDLHPSRPSISAANLW